MGLSPQKGQCTLSGWCAAKQLKLGMEERRRGGVRAGRQLAGPRGPHVDGGGEG